MLLDEQGYRKILQFETVPCQVYFHPEKAIVLSLGSFGGYSWVKASKQFYIKAMGTKAENGFYSKLQHTTQLMSYLKHSVPEFQCTLYYIGQLTPDIALQNFRFLPQLEQYRNEREEINKLIGGSEGREAEMLEQLELFRQAGTHNLAAKHLELTLRRRLAFQQKLPRLNAELIGGASIINEWSEKGHAAALLWMVSTSIRVDQSKNLNRMVAAVEDEIAKIEDQNIRPRAYHQDLLIEQVREPWHMFYAEAAGLFHPALLETYRGIPALRELAESVESWMNARLTEPITRTNYSEPRSTAVAETVEAMFRNVPAVEQIPGKVKTKLLQRALKKPIYLGYFAIKTAEGQEPTKEPCLIELDDTKGNALISGKTGSGKTRVAQILIEGAVVYVPVIAIDPTGEFTGLIHPNHDAAKEVAFNLPGGRAFEPEIYTLDDQGLRFQANLLLKPKVPDDDLLNTAAQEVANTLTHLMREERFNDIFREVLLEKWREDKPLTIEEFMDACRPRVKDMKTSVKLDRLLEFKMLMTGEALNVEQLLRKRLVIFSLNSNLYTEKQKLVVTWFIERQIHNYFLSQPHADETRAVLVVDEVHLQYAPNMPRDAGSVLEDIVKRGRAKGLAAVMISQSIHDLPGILTQANLRILLRILESEIQPYGDKFGMDLARSLHSLQPRFGYVFLGNEEFYCAFRPTLSSPKGVTDYQQIRNYTAGKRNLQSFLSAVTKPLSIEAKTTPPIETNDPMRHEPQTNPAPQMSGDETRFVQVLQEMGVAKSRSQIQRKLNWGTTKTIRIIKLLEAERKIQATESAHRTIIKPR